MLAEFEFNIVQLGVAALSGYGIQFPTVADRETFSIWHTTSQCVGTASELRSSRLRLSLRCRFLELVMRRVADMSIPDFTRPTSTDKA